MFCFVEQLCIPDCGEVAKKAEAEAVFKELLASCTSRLARTTLGVRPHEEALFDIIRGSIMNLYKRDYMLTVRNLLLMPCLRNLYIYRKESYE